MRPSFSDLTAAQQAHFGNGVGPYWMPDAARRTITTGASWFFRDASWRHHDFGYVVGGDRFDRARCDWKFLVAMLRDAMNPPNILIKIAAVALSLIFYVAVRVGGAFGSFQYRKQCTTLEDVLRFARIPAVGKILL